ncbi:rheacalcin-2-like [Festucalex cinctus]
MAFALRAFVLLCGIIGLAVCCSKQTGSDSCPKGWTQVNRRCFYFQDDGRTYADAESVCKLFGGNLASFSSALEYAVVRELVVEQTSTPNEHVWIGINRPFGGDDFVWTDGSPVRFTAFNNENDPGNCGEIDDDLLWDTDPCSEIHRFVCARDAKKKCCDDH